MAMFYNKARYINILCTTPNLICRRIPVHLHSSRQLSRELVVEGKSDRFKKEENMMNHLVRRERKESDLFFDDPDTFGTLSGFRKAEVCEQLDEDEQKEEKFMSEKPIASQRLSIKQYSEIIKHHLKHHRLKEALDVLEVRMIQEDRVQLDMYIYSILISACGKVGYTKKAFSLFNDMKRRALKPKEGIYASLFNACANSPWVGTDGHSRATGLRNLMVDKSIEPNTSIYNAMIKAFGRAGNLVTCFQIVDEMVGKKIKLRNHTFGFLMQACISDKESGFRHGLIVWKKMIERKECPTIYSFNLLLKCIKECGLGNEVQVEEMLKYIYGKNLILLNNNFNEDVMPMDSTLALNSLTKEKNASVNGELQMFTNFLPVDNSVTICVKSFCELKTPQDKFRLFGDCDEFLKEMKKYNVEPDIKTFTLLLEVIPNTIEAEEKLLAKIREFPKLYTDIDFYNILMKKRCYRYDYAAAKDISKLLDQENARRKKKIFFQKKFKLQPDIVTYGVLALTCKTINEGQELIKTMADKRLRFNIEIMGTLIRHAIVADDVDYVKYILDLVKADELKPNNIFLKRIQDYFKKCKNMINAMENKNKTSTDEVVSEDIEKQKRKDFVKCYAKWAKTLDVDNIPENQHPWKQYRELQPITFQRTNEEPLKKRFYKKRGKPYVSYVP